MRWREIPFSTCYTFSHREKWSEKKIIYLDIHLFNRCLLTICYWVNFVENPQFGKGRQKINKSLKYTIAGYNKGVQKVLWEHWEDAAWYFRGRRSAWNSGIMKDAGLRLGWAFGDLRIGILVFWVLRPLWNLTTGQWHTTFLGLGLDKGIIEVCVCWRMWTGPDSLTPFLFPRPLSWPCNLTAAWFWAPTPEQPLGELRTDVWNLPLPSLLDSLSLPSTDPSGREVSPLLDKDLFQLLLLPRSPSPLGEILAKSLFSSLLQFGWELIGNNGIPSPEPRGSG